jgi:hypothetical protein
MMRGYSARGGIDALDICYPLLLASNNSLLSIKIKADKHSEGLLLANAKSSFIGVPYIFRLA